MPYITGPRFRISCNARFRPSRRRSTADRGILFRPRSTLRHSNAQPCRPPPPPLPPPLAAGGGAVITTGGVTVTGGGGAAAGAVAVSVSWLAAGRLAPSSTEIVTIAVPA